MTLTRKNGTAVNSCKQVPNKASFITDFISQSTTQVIDGEIVTWEHELD
jgi:hypothetical protein